MHTYSGMNTYALRCSGNITFIRFAGHYNKQHPSRGEHNMAMKRRQRASEEATFSMHIKRSAISLAVAAALPSAMLAMPAVAQDADDEVIEEIITTGYRSSLINSIATKRDSSSIVEAISAEDIGKLPDASIGESLARLPGLAAQRFDGRANKISIRGLAPDFTTTMLNGRELVSSDNNRGVEYDQFPSEMITGATVYKTPDAALTAQAVGGTVDMQTVRPLNYRDSVLVFGLRGEIADEGKLNTDTDDDGYRGNISYIGQNDAGTFGYAIGYSRMYQPIQEEYIHVWGYSDITDSDGDAGLYIDGIKPFVKSNELTRDGVLGVLEWAPNDRLRARFDAFYSKFDDQQTLRGVEIAGYTAADRDIVNTTSNNLVQQGTWTDLRVQARNDFSDRDVETNALGFNLTYDINEDWSFEGDISWSNAEREYAAHEVYISNGRGQSGPANSYTYTLGGGNGLTVSTDADFADGSWGLGDNLGWGGPLCSPDNGWATCDSQDGFRNAETSEDDLGAIKLAAQRTMDGDFFSGVEFGMRYSQREKDHTRAGYFLTLRNYPSVMPVPDSLVYDSTSIDFLGVGEMLSFDARAVVASDMYFLSPESVLREALENWTVSEDVANLYVMANFDTANWSGNFGLQAVYTDQSSTGTQAGDPGGGTVEYNLVTQGTDFWEYLPSFNASYHISDETKLRMGAARILARPNIVDMRAANEYSYDPQRFDETDLADSPWGGNGGNPYLEPWTAWQFDLAIERYFSNAGYVALSLYHKELDNWVFTDTAVVDFSEIDVPGPDQPTLRQGIVTAPNNGEGGWIRGVEFATSLPFDVFSDSMRNFGLYVSASFTDSEVQETPDADPISLPGLSEQVINATIYYENDHGFSARVSQRYRDEFLAETFAIGLSRELTIAKDESILDAQLSWDLSSFGWEGVTLYAQGSNLTNEPFVQYLDNDPNKFKNYHTYGRSYMFGFTYKRQ